jgi:hypothetical protein
MKRSFVLLIVCALASCGRTSPSRTEGSDAVAQEARLLSTSVDDAQLSMVLSLDVDSRGRIYVADAMNPSVIVLGAGGTVEAQIGRRGRGPGEFLSVNIVQVLAGDSVFVFDHELNRTTVFSPGSYELAYTVHLTRHGVHEAPRWVKRVPGTATLLAVYSAAYTPAWTATEPRDDVLRLVDAEKGVLHDSILVFPPQEQLIESDGSSISVVVHPFGRRGIVDVGRDQRLYYAWTDTAAVGVYSPAGEPLHRLATGASSRSITADDVETILTRYGDEAPAQLDRFIGGHWPSLRGFVVDDRDFVWLGLTEAVDGRSEWVRLSPTGRSQVSVRLPGGVDLLAARGSRLYGVVHDEWDVPRVVVFAVSARE